MIDPLAAGKEFFSLIFKDSFCLKAMFWSVLITDFA